MINRIEREVYSDDMVILHDTNTEKEEIVEAASVMATNLKVKAIIVFTHSGNMALLTSRCRSSIPVFSFSRTRGVDMRLQLAFGVYPFFYTAPNDPEKKIISAFKILLLLPLIQVILLLSILGEFMTAQTFCAFSSPIRQLAVSSKEVRGR